jgi:hypothetical protein
MSVAIFDNNPERRRKMDNLILIRFHEKFFDKKYYRRLKPEQRSRLKSLNATCQRFGLYLTEKNYSRCGVIVPKEYKKPEYDK